MKLFELILEAAVGGQRMTTFKGQPAVVLSQDFTYQYLLQKDPLGKRAAELRPGDMVAVEHNGRMRPAKVMIEPKAANVFMLPTGSKTVAAGRAPSNEYFAASRGNEVRFRVKFIDNEGGEATLVKSGPTRIPFVTVVKRGVGPELKVTEPRQFTPRTPKPHKPTVPTKWMSSSAETLPEI